MCNGQCAMYTNDCSDKYAQWTANKQVLANQFYQTRHGIVSPTPPSPAYTAPDNGNFMSELERKWHRTLSTKGLYIGVPALSYSSNGIGGNPFSDQVTDIRGWDTQFLVGQVKDPTTGINGGDDCETYYNYCRPLGAIISLPNCSKLLAMCVMDPVFVTDFLPDSATLAGLQAPKLLKREQYLARLEQNATDVAGALPSPPQPGQPSPLIALADEVKAKLENLIAVDLESQKKPPILPNFATYVWQSPPPKGEPVGFWHAVKVEVLLPKRCYVDGAPDYDNFDCCKSGENKG